MRWSPAASDFLRSIGRNGQTVTMDKFVVQVLAPERLGRRTWRISSGMN